MRLVSVYPEGGLGVWIRIGKRFLSAFEKEERMSPRMAEGLQRQGQQLARALSELPAETIDAMVREIHRLREPVRVLCAEREVLRCRHTCARYVRGSRRWILRSSSSGGIRRRGSCAPLARGRASCGGRDGQLYW